jgi:hypothetical protein
MFCVGRSVPKNQYLCFVLGYGILELRLVAVILIVLSVCCLAEGVFVMTAAATDYDDPVTPNAELIYGIVVNKELNGQPVFVIDPKSGKIFAKVRLLPHCSPCYPVRRFRPSWIERIPHSVSL